MGSVLKLIRAKGLAEEARPAKARGASPFRAPLAARATRSETASGCA